MLLPVLLLLSLSTVQCGVCDWDPDRESFESMKSTIDSNLNGFRTVFPKDYHVDHHYKDSMLCADRCCVFPAAVILSYSWQTLLRNLWDEHLNHSFILDIKQSLDKIVQRNVHTESFQEEIGDLSDLRPVRSSPEELLRLTSRLLSRWLNVSCESSIATCPIPSLAPAAAAAYAFERTLYTAPRARLLTTREVHTVHDVPERLSNGARPPPSSLTLFPDVFSAWILLLCGRHLLLW